MRTEINGATEGNRSLTVAAQNEDANRAGPKGHPVREWRPRVGALTTLILAMTAVGCRQDMQDQPKYIPLRPSEFFADGRSERPLVQGTIARGHLEDDAAFYTGKGADLTKFCGFSFPCFFLLCRLNSEDERKSILTTQGLKELFRFFVPIKGCCQLWRNFPTSDGLIGRVPGSTEFCLLDCFMSWLSHPAFSD